jgi:G3E family GTPase
VHCYYAWVQTVSLFDRDKSAERLPVAVITGFLGSGKTTLLNRLLRHPGMGDSAVIINELGEIGLDHLLVEQVDGEVAVLSSGCVCCTVRSDLEESLRGLLAQRDRGQIPPFRRILVETTGLADPAPIVQLLIRNPLLMHFVRLDAVVTTVDAVNAARQLAEHDEAVKQIVLADRLLLTKTDLADDATLRSRLKTLNRAAPIVAVRHGDVDPNALFDAGPSADPRRWLDDTAYAGHDHDAADGHRHGSEIEAFCFAFDAPLDWMAVSQWLGTLRQRRGQDLLRVKGILNLEGEEKPVVVHGIHHVFHPPVALDAWPDDDRRSRLVFITRGMTRAEIEEARPG